MPCLPSLPVPYLWINTSISHPLSVGAVSFVVTNKLTFFIFVLEWKELLAQLLLTSMCNHAESDLYKVKYNLVISLVYLLAFSSRASFSAQYSAFYKFLEIVVHYR